jgi:tetratricopeptide (TPR) repeat protein
MAATLKEAVRFKPDLAEAHYLLGLASVRLGQWQEAALAFSRRLSLGVAAEGELRLAADGPSYYQEAMESMRQTVRMKPELARMRYHQGAVGTGFSNCQERLEGLKQAIATDPRNEQGHFNLGLTWVQLGRYQEAMTAFKTVLSLNPQNAMAHYRLALIYRTLGDPGAAVDEFAVLKTLDKQLAEQIFK